MVPTQDKCGDGNQEAVDWFDLKLMQREAWNEVMRVSIPKETVNVCFRAMRYISLLLVPRKLLRSGSTGSKKT